MKCFSAFENLFKSPVISEWLYLKILLHNFMQVHFESWMYSLKYVKKTLQNFSLISGACRE